MKRVYPKNEMDLMILSELGLIGESVRLAREISVTHKTLSSHTLFNGNVDI